jgi:hypothetical protein
MQPFDGGEFDKRYDEIYKPAIEEAGFEPYRVDRDPSAAIPIENIESGIRDSAACFADISTDNPNVWFELGYSICANKPLCLVCGHERDKFPFDIQHRKIIRYKKTSPSDFAALRSSVVERLKAIEEKDHVISTIIREPNSEHNGELGHLEFSALCIIFENQESDDSTISLWSLVNDMERAGYTKIATKIAVTRLIQRDMISVDSVPNQMDEGSYFVYGMKYAGTEYIMRNVDKITLRKTSKAAALSAKLSAGGRTEVPSKDLDDDIPF